MEKGEKDIEAGQPFLDEQEQRSDDQYTPIITGDSAPHRPKLSAAAIIPVWICLSSAVILYNNHLYNSRHFRYPVFLVTWHLTFAVRHLLLSTFIHFVDFFPSFTQAIGTRILQRTTHLLDGAKDVHMSKDLFLRSILPIGILFSGSLILSNKAYLHLTVPFIQMLKVKCRTRYSCLSSARLPIIYLYLHLCRHSHPYQSFSLVLCLDYKSLRSD
jgi:hypothetical protein